MKIDDSNISYKYIHDVATEKELRFIDDSDLISSDDTDNDDCNVNKPKNYIKLKPRANLVYKLLKSVKPQTGSIWKSDTNTASFNLLDSAEIAFDSLPDLPNIMAKISSKRKRDEVSSDVEISYKKKKNATKSSNSWTPKTVDLKKQVHLLSSSDGEHFVGSPLKVKKKHKKHDVYDRNQDNCNNHTLSSENDSSSEKQSHVHATKPNKVSEKLLSNQELYVNGPSAPEMYEDSDSGLKLSASLRLKQDSRSAAVKSILKSRSHNQDSSQIEDKLYREPNFTEEDKEEISKFSSLLSESLVEKNNIWFLQCPKNIDSMRLANQYLNLNGSCQLDVGDLTFDAHSYRDSKSLLLAVPSHRNHFQLRRIPITGTITVEECINIETDSGDNISESPESFQLPENLQTRHPLLGIDYENQRRTASRSMQIQKKKRHSTKYAKTEDELVEDDAVPSDSTDIARKKKKKSKHISFSLSMPEPEINSSNIDHMKKKKKNKHRSIEDLAEISVDEQQLVEESPEESKVKRKKKTKHNKDNF